VRGKPQGSAVYNVFLVEGAASAAPLAQAATVEQTLDLPTSRPSPEPDAIKTAIEAELAAHGGSWKAWTATLAKLYTVLHQRIERIPAGAKALAGGDGFLFFRNSIAYVLGGDLAEQKGDRNPLPVIVEFQRMLAARGVDFLFVPVPTKVEIFPDKTAAAGGDARLAAFAGQVVNPFERKLLLDLATLGVETVDLLPALLAERRAAAPGETLYQKQDTHWTAHGLELAARAIAERIRRYPWYGGIASKRRAYTVRDESFTRHGDLYNRLPEAERTSLSPETLVGHQVVSPDGSLYEDDPQSPIVVLGDSFTGVYHLMDCEHAGVSAHIAKEIGYPVDLLMSYGGGPNVREKLVKRGLDKLGGKKLVIWMMTARDLYDHADGWQPLKAE
jgi:alginate O-acetyltransferase complex protein AlgJ